MISMENNTNKGWLICQVEEKTTVGWEQTGYLWLCGTICECISCSQSSHEEVILCALCRGIPWVLCTSMNFISLRLSRHCHGSVNPSSVSLKSSSLPPLLGWEWPWNKGYLERLPLYSFTAVQRWEHQPVVVAGGGEFCRCSQACCLGTPASFCFYPVSF